ncbi:MAG: VRR-NUC domain-containing protein [Shewanella sp.]
MLERDIEKQSVAAAKTAGWYSFKVLSQLHKGLPDRAFIKDGKTVYIEYKTAKGELSPLQVKVAQTFAAHGVTIHVARSVADTMEILNNA